MSNPFTDAPTDAQEAAVDSRWRRAASGSRTRSLLPTATVAEAIGIVAGVIGPTLAKGVIIRRPRMVALVDRLDLDTRAVRRMQRLRGKYRGPLLIGPVRGRYWALILSPDHVQRILHGSPEPFATASAEKIAALSHFEPKGSLISQGADRAERRAFNEAILETDRPVHAMASTFVAVVEQEAHELLRTVDRAGELTWSTFATTWFRIVRRIVFGDAARDDHEITELIARLRSHANWAFLWPKHTNLRDRFLNRLSQLLARAEPGSLAAAIATYPQTDATAPAHQVPQWLFAFDPAGMTTFRALALLASHPDQAARAREEIRNARTTGAQNLRYVRACVLESLRLWPTAPLVLRQSIEDTQWDDGLMPSQTGIIIFAPFFHRDDERLPFAHRFAPEVWLQERPAEQWPLIPFSEGPARCPGRQLVELLTSTMLRALLDGRTLRLTVPPRLDPVRLPGTLNNYTQRFAIQR